MRVLGIYVQGTALHTEFSNRPASRIAPFGEGSGADSMPLLKPRFHQIHGLQGPPHGSGGNFN